MQMSFKFEEWNVCIRWSLGKQPIDYEYGDDSFILSGGLMLEGSHSHPVNLKAYIRHFTDDSIGIVRLSFDEALQVFDHIQIRTSAWPIQNSHGFSAQQVLGIRIVRRAWLHRAWTWLVLQRVVIKVWHSLSVEDLVEIPPSGYVCPGSRQMAVCNYGKGCVGMSSLDTGRLEMLKGTFLTPSGFAL